MLFPPKCVYMIKFIYTIAFIDHMYEELLREIGLTEGEIRVYIALLKIGTTSTGPLMKQSNISSSKIYLILDRLIERGLVAYSIENDVRVYEANSPDMIMNYLEEKQKKIELQKEKSLQLIKALKKIPKLKKEDEARVYNGINGIKLVHDQLLDELNPDEEYLVICAPPEAGKVLRSYWRDHNERRIEKRIGMKIIVDYGHPQIPDFKKYKYTQVRVLNPDVKTPAWIFVYRDVVVMATVTGTTILFKIHNKSIADSYKEFFKIMWQKAKPA